MRRRDIHALLIATALSRWAGATTPSSPAPYRVFDFDWVDADRSRPVPSRLYWPAETTAGAKVPLAVFSHGIGGSRQGYSYLGRHWSSRGVACLHVQHMGSDASLWRGNPFGVIGRLQAAAREGEALARVADLRFALDRMLSDATGGLGAAVDRRRLVAAGHSYGANTTLLAVGARVIRHGVAVDCRDARFAAAIVISAPPFYGEADLSAVLGPVAVPSMHITATRDVIEIPGYRSPAADRLAVFEAVGDPRKLLAVFEGGSHSMFTDRAFTGGTDLNPKVKAATAELSLAFLDLAFRGDSLALHRWQAAWRPIVAAMPEPQFPTVPPASSGPAT